ncbi:GPR endopeptidase [Salsuginibacillus halophilus]|uniref:Germination protease n=1 Tax=Salsuginibacillus halophilus TaxID=517424 RepID=A0A2P8HFR6_9BACI|nr:GPR endopeptidase [Salsuginibacillus halophilus]PSL45041.1 GPR endopeptidase [Salsuginibacillus halophilus]
MSEKKKPEFRYHSDLMVEDEYVEKQQEHEENERRGVQIEESEDEGIHVVRVVIDEEGAKKTGRDPGRYVTLEAQGLRGGDQNLQQTLSRVFARSFVQFLNEHHISPNASCLVVGLGNREVTPDALGPKTVDELHVTRHLFKEAPETVEKGYRPVSAIAPGVMGVTGVETSDIIHALVKQIEPDAVIAIDALASKSLERLNTTVQMSDTGIHPGSGVQNERKQLNEKTLGVPVFAVGIPTVVDAVSITSDAMDYLLKHLGREKQEGDAPAKRLAPSGMTFGERRNLGFDDLPLDEDRTAWLGAVGQLQEEEKRQLIQEVLAPLGHNLMVTPKEVDTFMDDMAHMLAQGMNAAFHEAIDEKNTGTFTH